jgi:hypothetical protein
MVGPTGTSRRLFRHTLSHALRCGIFIEAGGKTMPSPNRRGRRLVLIVASLLAFALVASACEIADWEVGGTEREWYCDPTDVALNDGPASGATGVPHFPYTEEKGPLSALDCFALDFQLTVASQYAALFPTKAYAEANGWNWLAPWIPGQGTHNVNAANGVTTTFDPFRPTMLMFDGNGDNAPLTGMVWAVESDTGPPEGFGGGNDQWHVHATLCITPGPFVVGSNISDELCTQRGGVNQDTSNIWLLHVWLPIYKGWVATDIFNRWHPFI